MFNLEEKIAEWRRGMHTAGVKNPEVLDELESHLREDIERKARSGSEIEAAFQMVVEQTGRADVLKEEFVKAGAPLFEQLKSLLINLAGIPNHQLASTMKNSDANIESPWATYLKAATFLFPPLILWLSFVVFVLPKVNEVCQKVGIRGFYLERAPFVFRALGVVGQAMIFLTNHWVFAGGVPLLALILLEWRFRGWMRYRRTAIGIGAFVLNAVVLVSFVVMIVTVLIAAQQTSQI
jgi:hypothetical protein